jgi:large subunit ribosomal protein L30
MLYAVVRVRGRRNINPKAKKTLELLMLKRTNYAVLVPDTPVFKGMLRKVRDYVAYGPVSEDVVRALLSKRAKLGSKRVSVDEELVKEVLEHGTLGRVVRNKINAFFALRPPRKGYKSIKRHYPYGALGEWPSLDELLKRMM